MKIGILTLPLNINYGGILQAYALQTVLEMMGHEAKIITLDYSAKTYPFYQVIYCFLRRVASRVTKKTKIDFYNINKESHYYAQLHKKQSVNIDKFINQHIKCHLYRSLSEDVSQTDFDAFVVGSDQIWRRQYIQGTFKIYDAYMSFAQSWQVKRVAYAASFGVDHWDYNQTETEKIKTLVKLFDAVSVREQSGVDLCSTYLNIKAVCLLDPTLLLGKEQYEQIIKHWPSASDQIHQGVLTHYVLDQSEEMDKLIEKVENDKGLTPFSLDLYKAKVKNSLSLPSVEQWLTAFYNASFVITDSFHACVFCIIFHKPFIVMGNKRRGYTRFLSLLQTFGLEKNLITSVTEYVSDEDYSIPPSAYIKLNELKQISYQFLYNNLS